MKQSDSAERDYQRIEHAMRFVAANYRDQPDLAEIASAVHLSEAHFQRLFKRWAGVSPKQFLQYLTLEHARHCLRSDMSVVDASLDSGLSAPARLNELFVRLESVTPAEYKQQGKGIVVEYGYHQTAFGLCLIGVTERGLSGLEFCLSHEKDKALEGMALRLPAATYQHNPQRTVEFFELIFQTEQRQSEQRQPQLQIRSGQKTEPSLSLLVKGTPFQIKVWEALLRIPAGRRISYKQLAESVDKPGASRAVGSAVGRNPVAVLIPCHRVIREDGMLGGYHWGLERKLALLGSESVGRISSAGASGERLVL